MTLIMNDFELSLDFYCPCWVRKRRKRKEGICYERLGETRLFDSAIELTLGLWTINRRYAIIKLKFPS